MPPRQSRTSRKMKREQGPMQVLLAYDGSAGADQAAAFVLARSWPTGATIHVVAVLEPSTALVPAIPLAPVRLVSSPELEGELEAHLRQQVDAVIQRLRAADLTADGAVLIGRPAVVLTEEAGRLAADLIVVGSRGHGPISSLLLGSVSAEVVDHAKAPVLVARGADAERVLLASDGSSAARRAEQLVEQWPTFDGATIRVLSVAEITRAWHTGLAPTMHAQVLEAYAQDREAAKAAHQAIAEDAASRLGQAGRSVDARVRIGDAAGEIVEEAAAWPADLVVLGSRGLTGLPRVVLGSVARNVLQGSHGSVLIVREAPAGDADR